MSNSIFKDVLLDRSLNINGFAIIDLLDNKEIDELKEIILKNFVSFPDGFYSSSFSLDDGSKSIVHPYIERLVFEKLSNTLWNVKSLGACVLNKSPNSEKMLPHQDWTIVNEKTEQSFTIWIPLSDCENINGAIRLVPGSHRFSEALRAPTLPDNIKEVLPLIEHDLVTIPLKAGQGLIFNHALIHASHSNESEQNRLVVTVGFTHNNAELYYYFKNAEGIIEKYAVPDNFFALYNTNIGQKPEMGIMKEIIKDSGEVLSGLSYSFAKNMHLLNPNKPQKHIALFKETKVQESFNKDGFLVLPLLTDTQVKELTEFYYSLNLPDTPNKGFHVSMDQLNEDESRGVRNKIWSVVVPELSKYCLNFKPYVASYVVKEPNPTGYVPPHQDWTFVDDESEGFCSLTCWVALVPTSLENGCMGVIKESHRYLNNHRPSPSPQTPVPLSEHMFKIFPYLKTIEMRPGDVLIFDNRTFHASPPNTSGSIRLAAGVGITQSNAQLIHYFLKPDSRKNTLLKYKVDEDFFLKYNNARLSNLYEQGGLIEDYPMIEEVYYENNTPLAEPLIQTIINSGNELNKPLCERLNLNVVVNHDETTLASPSDDIEKATTDIDSRTFFQKYTPINIYKEIKGRLIKPI